MYNGITFTEFLMSELVDHLRFQVMTDIKTQAFDPFYYSIDPKF